MIKERPSSIVRDSETVKLERKVGYLCYLESKIDNGLVVGFMQTQSKGIKDDYIPDLYNQMNYVFPFTEI